MRKLILVTVISLTACLETKENTEPFGAIPPVVINCHSAQSASCVPQKAGRTVFVGLGQESLHCPTHLEAMGSHENLNQLFEAVGLARTTVEGPFLVGKIDEWYNFGGVEISELPQATYAACAFIDLNGDERWQVEEPLGSGKVRAGGYETVIDDWF